MKKSLLTMALAVSTLTACVESGNPQFAEMPAGPLQSYSMVQVRDMSDDTLLYIKLWRVDSLSTGGLFTYKTNDANALASMPMPVKVNEAVFDSVYRLMKEHQFYKFADWYKTGWKGDAYAYVPWTLEAVFPAATLHTVSDGTSPKGFDYKDYSAVDLYLERLYTQTAYRWLALQPINLADYPTFSDLGHVFSAPDTEEEDGAAHGKALKRQLRLQDSDETLEEFTLLPDGFNSYRDKSGKLLKLQWVQSELMLTCSAADGKPLWAMSAHQSFYDKGSFQSQLKHVVEGEYTTADGQKVTIGEGKILGFQGKEQLRCVIYDYHDIPAERLHIGEYPDEQDFAFKRSHSGLNIYATKYEEKDEYDWDSVPTEPIMCLQRCGTRDYSWLHRELLDSYILRYYDKAEREAMLKECERAAEPNACDSWNAQLLRSFMDVAPFDAEPDCQ